MIDTRTEQPIYATDALVKSEDVKLQYLFHLSTSTTLIPTTPTISTTLAPTQDPWDLCNDFCFGESQDGLFPLPGLEPCCLDGGPYCECSFCSLGCFGEIVYCGEGEGFCDVNKRCITVDKCNVEECCPNLPLITTTPTTTLAPTEDPDDLCFDLCAGESQDGVFSLPIYCCLDGGPYCECSYCSGSVGSCIGSALHCGEGEGFCDESKRCIAVDTCFEYDLDCCQNLPLLSTPTTLFPTTPTPAPTEDPYELCLDLCYGESQDGLLPLPGLESCCLDGGPYCKCGYCSAGICIGWPEHCGAGEGFCDESKQCVAVDFCNVEDCCPNLDI